MKRKKEAATVDIGCACAFKAVLTIDHGILNTTDSIQTFPGGPVVWLVVNNDEVEYTVVIPYSEIIRKKDKKKGNPFPKNKALSIVTVEPKSTGAMVALIDGDAPAVMYKYTVHLFEAGDEKNVLDPDLDVVPPGSVVIS